jgi:hypothetical protein
MLYAAVLVALAFVAVALIHAIRTGFVNPFQLAYWSDRGALDFAAADAVLKEDYKAPVVEQLSNASVLLAVIEKNTDDIRGRRFVQALHVGRNSGVGARAEGGTLPTAGNQQYEDIFGPCRYQYGRIQISGPVIAAMTKDRTSFLRAIESETEGLERDLKRNLARQVWGTSNGQICGVQTINSTTITPGSGTGTALRRDQLLHLEEGFLIDIGTTADPDSIASGRSVTSVNYTTGAFTISGAAVNVTAGTHFVYAHGAGGASDNTGNPADGQIEWTGIQTIVDDADTLHTLTVAAEPRWKAGVYGNSGNLRSISENLVSKSVMRQNITSGKFVDLLIGNDGVFRAYGEVLSTMKRTMNEIDLEGGFTGLSIGFVGQGVNKKGQKQVLCWDQDAPDGRLYGLDTDAIRLMVAEDWDWIDRMGSMWNQVGDTDAYSATMAMYAEIACNRRNSQLVIEDLSEA